MNKTIFGISAGFHDAALTVTRGDQILFASHSERFSKIKHDKNLNTKMLSWAYGKFGTPDEIAYYENHLAKKMRQFRTGENYNVFRKNPVKDVIDNYGEFCWGKIPFKSYSHHLSHAAAGFQTSEFDMATVVVIDAIGEWDCVSIWAAHYDNCGYAKYKKLWSSKYPNSIGLFYSAFTKHVGLKPLDEEYIMMGMCAYGKPIHTDSIKDKLIEDMYELKFKENLHIGLNESFLFDKNSMDIAASAQSITEDMVRNVMHRAAQFGWSTNLVYSGGVALNCLANRDLGTHFKNIWIMPNPGDAGSSLGAAALSYGKKLDWRGPYLGYNIDKSYPVDEAMYELIHESIVGVANGPAEFGPRALGNRSLLADPRIEGIKERVNSIKQRQQFRPFAPVILEEYVNDYFVMPKNWDKSDYMQVVAKCKYPDRFPAIIHADGTSRVQTVPKDCKSGIRQLLEEWHRMSHCPMLLNTSLNIRGEPMVNDWSDAERFEKKYGVIVV